MTTTNQTITIRGRSFSVSTQTTPHGTVQYILTGKRGAVYGTIRHAARKDRMFLVSGRARMLCSLGDVWLSDASGKLEVLS
jgi:hypothetical protein